MGLKLVEKQSGRIKLVPVEGPAVPGYSQGFIDGLGAGCQLSTLIAYFFEGYGGKDLSRLLIEAAGGRNPDGHSIETPGS